MFCRRRQCEVVSSLQAACGAFFPSFSLSKPPVCSPCLDLDGRTPGAQNSITTPSILCVGSARHVHTGAHIPRECFARWLYVRQPTTGLSRSARRKFDGACSLQGRWAEFSVAASPGVAGHERGGPLRLRRDDRNAGTRRASSAGERERERETETERDRDGDAVDSFILGRSCCGFTAWCCCPTAREMHVSGYCGSWLFVYSLAFEWVSFHACRHVHSCWKECPCTRGKQAPHCMHGQP